MPRSALVLGAGMVGVSVALHLRHRGLDVMLVDRQDPGEGASFGNGGLIQREAVHPHPFPRTVGELWRVAKNRSVDVRYDPLALPGFASPLLRYWWHSEPHRFAGTVVAWERLIATCIDEHMALAKDAGATDMLRPLGFMRLYSSAQALEAAAIEAEATAREHGLGFRVLDTAGVAAAEPHLLVRRAGAVHWTDTLSCPDPHALTMAYFGLFTAAGGRFAHGDAGSLQRTATGWRVQGEDGPLEAEAAVVALGVSAPRLTARFGYAPPTFGKRGYHRHYKLQGNAVLNSPMVDMGSGFLMAPMAAGVRLTTGAEFVRDDAGPSPIQLARAEPIARGLLPLAEGVEATPWMGTRPCSADMLPIIGQIPGQQGLWGAFGHGHQGFTLGPTTGRMLAEMMTGEAPFVEAAPYRPERF